MADDPQARQRLLLGVALFGLLGFGGYTYVYKPRAAEIDVMEVRLENLVVQNRTAQAMIARNGRDDLERRLAQYRDQLKAVEGLIPTSEEVPDLLDAISAEARRTGVDLSRIQPTGAMAGEFYTRRTYDLSVLGAYHQVADFLARVGSLPRIITPIQLNVSVKSDSTKSGEPQLEAKFAIETYVLPPNTAHVE